MVENIIYLLRKEFNKLVKIIYIDPEEKISEFQDNDGKTTKFLSDDISFSVDMIFYLLLSQYFKKVKIKFGGEEKDLRCSFFLILLSRMGKGQLIKEFKQGQLEEAKDVNGRFFEPISIIFNLKRLGPTVQIYVLD